jgi:hypothetical protein
MWCGRATFALSPGFHSFARGFVPAEVTAHVRDTIEWVNTDFVAHTATARDGAWDVVIPVNATKGVVLRLKGRLTITASFTRTWRGGFPSPNNRAGVSASGLEVPRQEFAAMAQPFGVDAVTDAGGHMPFDRHAERREVLRCLEQRLRRNEIVLVAVHQ